MSTSGRNRYLTGLTVAKLEKATRSMETGPMLPFHHVYHYTLFPTAQCVGARWVGVIRVLEGTGTVRCQTIEEEFDTEYAAIVGATIDAASVANLIRAGF